jgi:hypothetical protein
MRWGISTKWYLELLSGALRQIDHFGFTFAWLVPSLHSRTRIGDLTEHGVSSVPWELNIGRLGALSADAIRMLLCSPSFL